MTFKSFGKEQIKLYISKYEKDFQEYEWKDAFKEAAAIMKIAFKKKREDFRNKKGDE